MKHLSVKKIATSVARAEDVPALLDAQGVEFQPIDCVDWAADYPYAPKVEFRIAHKGDAVLIEYRVSEQSVAAVAPHANGRGWEDSCCECLSSLGRAPFAERIEPTTWHMALIIPTGTAFHSQIATLDGARMKANFYKCGDKLQTPHFLSWNRIDLPSPNFHRPDFFGTLEFER